MCVAIVVLVVVVWSGWSGVVSGGGCVGRLGGITERRVSSSRSGGGRWRHQLMPPVDASFPLFGGLARLAKAGFWLPLAMLLSI